MDQSPGAAASAGSSSAVGGRLSLLLEHFGAILMALTDFVLFQAVATLLTVAIYFTIPALDASIRPGGADWRWIDIFRIVSPTFTVSGGAVTVLTSYFFARKSQESDRLRQEEARLRREAEQQRHEAERERHEAERERHEAERERLEAEHERQEEARLRQDAEREHQEAEQRRQEEARLRQEAEARVQTLEAQLEQATAAPRRRNRRRLRNGPSRRER